MSESRVPIPKLSEKDILRFWSKVDVRGDGECWPWTGNRTRKKCPYGSLSIRSVDGTCKTISAHRIAYLIHYGNAPTDMCVCHKCDSPECVNPSHLFAGTHSENMKDMLKKGRSNKLRGEDVWISKLTDQAVVEVRNRATSGESYSSIGKCFGVTPQAVYCVVHRKTWAHVQ